MVREFLAVAVRAVLQWALASLLLANGAAFCLIATVSESLRLGPPCVLCARVHRLLCSSAAAGGGEGRDALRLILCEAHVAAVAASSPEQQSRVVRGRGRKESEGLDVDDQNKGSGLENRRDVSIGSEICEQDHDDANGSDAEGPGGTDDDGNGPLVSLFELAPITAHPRNDSEQSLHKPTTPELHNVEGVERLTVGQLLSLRAQRRELDALRAELEDERRARAAAEEYQQQLEEQGELDREAARLAMELVHETESEKLALQQQLEACRVRAQLCGGGKHASVGDEGGGRDEAGGGCDNNYQSLVDFLPGSVYSSSPDLADLLKLYTESGNGDRRQRERYAPAVTVVAEEVDVAAGGESSVDVDASWHVETVTKAA